MAWTAAVCKSGHLASAHIVNAPYRLENDDPTYAQSQPGIQRMFMGSVAGMTIDEFCGLCGARVITMCESCSRAIPSPYLNDYSSDLDAFCRGCGLPFPWATREQRINGIRAALNEEALDPAERLELIEDLAVLSVAESEADVDEQVRVVERLRAAAPKIWEQVVRPILVTTIGAEVRRQLGI